ncbi:MAG: hypothetical protein ACO3O3_08025 [Ilumatobacteraceae bacterium]
MAILEYNWRLSDNQTVTADGVTLSTNTVDLQDVRDLGPGRPAYVHFYVNTSATGSATLRPGTKLDIEVLTASNSAMTTGRVSIARAVMKPPLVSTSTPPTPPLDHVAGTLADSYLVENTQFFLPLGSFQVGLGGTPYAGASGLNGPDYTEYLGSRYLAIRYNWYLEPTSGSPPAPTTLTTFAITSRLTLDQSTQPLIYPASTNT